MAGDGSERGDHQVEIGATTALARRGPAAGDPHLVLHSEQKRRSVATAPPKHKHWQPPEGLAPAEVKAVIAAATEPDRLLLRVLWATGGRVSEVLALRPKDVRRDALVLPNRKNPSRQVKTVFLAAGDADLLGELLL